MDALLPRSPAHTTVGATEPDWPRYLESVLRTCEERLRDHYVGLDTKEFQLYLMAELLESECRATNDQSGRMLHREREERETASRVDVIAGLKEHAAGHVLLVGRPGSGKTTALYRLQQELAKSALKDPTQRVPVLLELRRLRKKHDIWELLKEALIACGHKTEQHEIEGLLLSGSLFLIFDGLNEVCSQKAAQELRNFCDSWLRSQPLVASTRDIHLGGTLGIVKQLDLLRLTEPQAREFIERRLPGRGAKLASGLRGRFRELAETPLFLVMLCDFASHSTQSVPDRPGLFFRSYCQDYARRRQELHGPDIKFGAQWQACLERLAFEMLEAQELEITLQFPRQDAEASLRAELGRPHSGANPERASAVLDELLGHHLLRRVFDSQDSVEFSHQLVQEYYAAERLAGLMKGPQGDVLTNEVLLGQFLNRLKWTEPLLLMMNFIDQRLQGSILALAKQIEIRLHARLLGRASQILIITGIPNLAGDIRDYEHKHALLALTENPHAVPSLLEDLKDKYSRVRASAAGVLGNIRDTSLIPHLLKALTDEDSNVCQAAGYALVKIGGSKAVEGLLEALKNENDSTRKEAASALGQIGGSEVIAGLLQGMKDEAYSVRSNAGYAMQRVGNSETSFALIDALQDEKCPGRSEIAFALGRLGDRRAISGLLQALRNEDSSVRHYALFAIALIAEREGINEREVMPALQLALLDDSFGVRMEACRVIGNLVASETAAILHQPLSDEEPAVRSWAVMAIACAACRGTFNIDAAICILRSMLQDQDDGVRWRAVQALATIGGKEVTALLREAIDDPIPLVHNQAIEALGYIAKSEAVSTLLEILNHGNQKSRIHAVLGLRWCGSQAVAGLVGALHGQYEPLRDEVIDSLRRIEGPEATRGLIQALKDPSELLRCKAALYLGERSDPQVFAPLSKAMCDESSTVRSSAARALARTGTVEAVEVVMKALQDRGVEKSVAIELVKLPLSQRDANIVAQHIDWRELPNLQAKIGAYRFDLSCQARPAHSLGQANHKKKREGATRVIKQKTVFHGDAMNVNISAGHIENVRQETFNQIKSSNIADDLKRLLTELAEQTTTAATSLAAPANGRPAPEEQQQQALALTDSLARVTDEAAKPRPKLKWFELSLEGLKEAAVAVGDVGKPILETVAKLNPLIADLLP